MIIRKPYAFLIKYFKIIHIVLFAFMTYLLFRVRNVYMFFKNYIATGTYTFRDNMVSSYINIPMIIFTIVLIAFLLLIFFLMRQKKKPIFYYLTATIFYFISFVAFLYFISVFSNLEYQTYSNQALVIYRDLTMVLYFANYYFLAIAFVRGFGFNVKKFNFEKDLKELEISEEDREEIEVASPIDVDNVTNFLRKSKRNLGYYFKENSFVLIVFAVVLVLSLATYFTVDRLVINKIYREKSIIETTNINYVINNSYVTTKDKYGKNVKNKDTYYLLVDFTAQNKSDEKIKLSTENTRIKIGKEYYYPTLNLSARFSDIGTFYRSQSIPVKSSNRYLMMFEIKNPDVLSTKVIMELYVSKKVKDGEAILNYKTISLTPYKFNDKDLGTYKLNSSVDLKDTYLKSGKFNLISYEITDLVDYTYTKCDNKNDGECTEYKASVVPKSSGILLKVKYNSDIEKDIFTYLNLEYSIGDNTKKVSMSDIKNVTPTNYNEEGTVLLEVPKDLMNLENIKFNFDIRGVEFTYE